MPTPFARGPAQSAGRVLLTLSLSGSPGNGPLPLNERKPEGAASSPLRCRSRAALIVSWDAGRRVPADNSDVESQGHPIAVVRAGNRLVHCVLGFVLAGGLALFAMSALPVVRGVVPASFFGNWVVSVITVVAAVQVVLRVVAVREQRWVWLPLAVGLSSYAAGAVLWSFWIQSMPDPPFPSFADALWLPLYPLGYATIVLAIRQRTARFTASVWLDGLIAALALSALVGALILPTVLGHSDGKFSAVVVNAAYPIGDLLLIGAIAAGCAMTGWRLSRAWLVLAAGFLCLTVADVLYLSAVVQGSYETELLPNFFWLSGVVLMAFAARAPHHQMEPSSGPGHLAALGPSLCASAAVGLIVFDHFEQLDAVSLALTGATIAVAVLRLTLTVREERRLRDSHRQALTDELTGLPNRRALGAELSASLKSGTGGRGALLLADLNGFKELNDTLGHDAGDELLCAVAARLREALRDDDVVARLGGDEFAILARSCTDADQADLVARKILATIQRPFAVRGLSIQTGISVGVVCYPEHGSTVSELLKRADVAMYRAKEARTGVERYDSDHDGRSTDRLALAGGLGTALARGEITAHYQPQVDPVTGRLVGVEALARWEHPQRGLLLPGEFLAAVEQTNFSRALTMRMLDVAARDWSRWMNTGLDVSVAVNLAAVNLIDEAFPGDVSDVLRAHGMPPDRLILEVTETSIITDPIRALSVLGSLRDQGIHIALDDFGTEHSSLSHLHTLPVDEIKIDRSFVRRIAYDERTAAIVTSIVALARTLGLRCVAEGIEDEATRAVLVDVGCECAQGFLFARPMPAEQLPAWSLEHAVV
jgi:diguanylate cyclase (GGDEF)-like protein